MDIRLFDDYSLRITEDNKEFFDFFSKKRSLLFSENITLNVSTFESEEEKLKKVQLKSEFGIPYSLKLYILKNEEIIGWSFGEQKDPETFYMINTALFKEHQNKGIYKSLLPKILDILKEKGFQKVYSIHHATNNQVIIPKLRQGFVITSLEVNEYFGVMVRLTFYFNENRKNAIEYRVGKIKADDKLKQALSLNENEDEK